MSGRATVATGEAARRPVDVFATQHRRFALLAQAIAGRPLRLERCGRSVDAAALPLPGRDAGTVRVPADPGDARDDADAQRRLRLGVLREALRATDPPDGTPAWLRRERPVLERRVLALLDRARIDAALRRRCPGVAAELDAAAARGLARRAPRRADTDRGGAAFVRTVLDALAGEVLGAPRVAAEGAGGDRARAAAHGPSPAQRRGSVHPRDDAHRFARALEPVLDEVPPLRVDVATALDARAAARRIVAWLVAAAGRRPGAGDRILVDGLEAVSDAQPPLGMPGSASASGRGDDGPPSSADGDGAGAPADGERAREGAPGGGRGADPGGAVVVDPAAPEPVRDVLGRPRRPGPPPARRAPPAGALVDEWDSVNGTMLRAWCRIVETRLRGTDTRFLDDVRRRHPALWDELRRRLARTRPTGRRRVRGVGDGDELDLDGVVASVVDRRAGRASDEHAYARRDPVTRDVAAAFLADLSASTAVALPAEDASTASASSPASAAPRASSAAWIDTGALLYGVYDDDPPAAPAAPRRRVVDVERDALALMAATLDALGDACALWGFSGDGRDRVEFMVAKEFADPLNGSTWAALAAMQPRGSTRMGAAIRHACAKLRREAASRRLLVVVSDGYPQDSDYGPDRLDVEYGIRDTARALADAEREGIVTFCVTVDPAGHDYLRRMCPPNRYRVIDDVPQLPAALAEVYATLAGRG